MNGDVAYVTDPATKKIHVVDIYDGRSPVEWWGLGSRCGSVT